MLYAVHTISLEGIWSNSEHAICTERVHSDPRELKKEKRASKQVFCGLKGPPFWQALNSRTAFSVVDVPNPDWDKISKTLFIKSYPMLGFLSQEDGQYACRPKEGRRNL